MILHHVLAGTGPAVLLLHSTATDSRQWKVQIEVLGQDFTVVAPDLRGYGRPSLTSEPFSHVDDITRLMDSLSFEDFAIVASSGGGAIALQVASAVPKRVRAMVLLCAAAQGVEPTAELRSFGEKENALLEGGDVAGATELNVRMWVQPLADEVTRELFRDMKAHAFRLQLAAGETVQERDVETDLACITCPVTVVSGARDLSWFHAVADQLAAELPNATRIDLPWAGHLPNLERPAETSRLIRDWIRTGRRRSAMHDRELLGTANVSDETLTELVAALFQEPPDRVTVVSSEVERVAYDLPAITTAGRYWVRGQALVGHWLEASDNHSASTSNTRNRGPVRHCSLKFLRRSR